MGLSDLPRILSKYFYPYTLAMELTKVGWPNDRQYWLNPPSMALIIWSLRNLGGIMLGAPSP